MEEAKTQKEMKDGDDLPPEIDRILNLVESVAIRKSAARVPTELWSLSDADLGARYKPTRTGKALRVALWNGIRETVSSAQKIKLTELARSARCSYPHAYELFTRSPEFLVWALRPIHVFSTEMDTLLNPLADLVSEIAHLPTTDSRGRLISRNAKAILRVVELLLPKVKN